MAGFGAAPSSTVAIAGAGGERVEDVREVDSGEQVVAIDFVRRGAAHAASWSSSWTMRPVEASSMSAQRGTRRHPLLSRMFGRPSVPSLAS